MQYHDLMPGVLPIVQTPLTSDDRIDAAALQREIDWAFQVGANGVGTGMVSEILRLTDSERRWLTEHIVEYSEGRGPVFAAVGAESATQALDYALHAEQAGCAAVMAAPPLTTNLSVSAHVDYFSALADGVSLPIIVQDASSYVGRPIPIEVYLRLLNRYGQRKILFKPEAAPIGPNLTALRDATNGHALIYEGSGGILLIDSYRRGIVGTMPGMDLLDGIVKLWQALEREDDSTAYDVYFPICALVTLQMQAGLDGFLAIEKHILVKRGLFESARTRTPCGWTMDAETAVEVDRIFEQFQRVVATID